MTYQEASKIGKVLDGYIKCTYALLYNESHKGRFFSLQARHTKTNQVYEDFAASLGASDEEVAVTYQVPVVQAAANMIDERNYVPVMLTDYALNLVANKLVRQRAALTCVKVTLHVNKHHTDAGLKRNWGDWKYYDKYDHYLPGATEYHAGGKLEKEYYIPDFENNPKPYDWFDEKYYLMPVDWGHYTIRKIYGGEVPGWEGKIMPDGSVKYPTNQTIVAEMEKEREQVKKEYSQSGLLWVKECAIDWIPTDFDNSTSIVNGKDLDIKVALEVSRKKLDRAKALLITAGATNIL